MRRMPDLNSFNHTESVKARVFLGNRSRVQFLVHQKVQCARDIQIYFELKDVFLGVLIGM